MLCNCIRKVKVIALALFVGALPFLFCAPAHADEVGLTYGGKATVQTNYLWRGLYAGAFNLQTSANVGYGGAYFDMWWSLGSSDWQGSQFVPELDLSIGFKRWGLNVFLLYIHNFNCGFFDFANYTDKGNRLELDASYTISEAIPLRLLWATRVSAADGYINSKGELVRAWSSYIEISYTQRLPYDMSLYAAIGMSPWRSCYSGYRLNFAVPNIELQLCKDWSASEHIGVQLFGQFAINPSLLALDTSTAEWHPNSPHNQTINANAGVTVYWK